MLYNFGSLIPHTVVMDFNSTDFQTLSCTITVQALLKICEKYVYIFFVEWFLLCFDLK